MILSFLLLVNLVYNYLTLYLDLGMILEIIKSGSYSTLQDMGREGLQHYGIPMGGALDRKSAMHANALVGNPPKSPVIEMTIKGGQFIVSQDCFIAVTGADLDVFVNDVHIACEKRIHVKAGSKIKCSYIHSGIRSYLAIGGDWHLTPWGGSISPLGRGYESLTPDSILRDGQRITIDLHNHESYDFTNIKCPQRPFSLSPGPEGGDIYKKILAQSFTISPMSDRMGLRLVEPIETHYNSMISAGVLPGTIQWTPSGQLIILHRDAQTTGGYPRVAIISTIDLDRLAQLRPGERITFVEKSWL
jgi:biotin-dependent carboxylase-like uncharacterized protein